MNDTPTPSPFATDGQRTTDAECWMNYCLEAEKGLAAVTEQRDEAWQKIENQAERITYLEGATNHATGTPLSKAIEQRDRLAEEIRLTLMDNLDLCDGDICTLKRLKDAIGFELDHTETTL
jgi:hypothetical protein